MATHCKSFEDEVPAGEQGVGIEATGWPDEWNPQPSSFFESWMTELEVLTEVDGVTLSVHKQGEAASSTDSKSQDILVTGTVTGATLSATVQYCGLSGGVWHRPPESTRMSVKQHREEVDVLQAGARH